MSIKARLHELICKLVGSRKSLYNILGKIESWLLILAFAFNVIPDKNTNAVLIIYCMEQVRVLSYMGIIQFEKVKTQIKVGT